MTKLGSYNSWWFPVESLSRVMFICITNGLRFKIKPHPVKEIVVLKIHNNDIKLLKNELDRTDVKKIVKNIIINRKVRMKIYKPKDYDITEI